MSKERKYSEQEIAAIFKYAASAQEFAGQHNDNEDGLSLAELQKIGEGSGIQNLRLLPVQLLRWMPGRPGIIQELAFGRPVALKKDHRAEGENELTINGSGLLSTCARYLVHTVNCKARKGPSVSGLGKMFRCMSNQIMLRVTESVLKLGNSRRGVIDLALGMGADFFL